MDLPYTGKCPSCGWAEEQADRLRSDLNAANERVKELTAALAAGVVEVLVPAKGPVTFPRYEWDYETRTCRYISGDAEGGKGEGDGSTE